MNPADGINEESIFRALALQYQRDPSSTVGKAVIAVWNDFHNHLNGTPRATASKQIGMMRTTLDGMSVYRAINQPVRDYLPAQYRQS